MAEPFALPAELTIYTVAERRTHLLAGLADAARERARGAPGDDACRVDASAVAEVDGAGVQLLLALDRELARAQWPLQLTRPSAALAQACASLGVAATLGVDATAGAAA
jgi:ABC-type transporter Mla MlaB component